MKNFTNMFYCGVWISYLFWRDDIWVIERDRASELWYEFINMAEP